MNYRVLTIRALFLATTIILSVRIFNLQILDEKYKAAAEKNITLKIPSIPYRGIIYDRNGQLIAYNEPMFDLQVTRKEFLLRDSVKLKEYLGFGQQTFMEAYSKALQEPSPFPITLARNLSMEDLANFQDYLVDTPGIYLKSVTSRGYSHPSLAHVLGYVGEISEARLRQDTTEFYQLKDRVGITGLEQQYEKQLRGKKGMTYKIIDARGKVIESFDQGRHDVIALPGTDITTTIDLELQLYCERLLRNRPGSIVALRPADGEILALASYPTYDPGLLSGRNFSSNYLQIASNPQKPFLNRAIHATYAPGSLFKIVHSLVALQGGFIRPEEYIYLSGGYVGDHLAKGYYNLESALTHSSNNFFYVLFRRMVMRGEYPNKRQDATEGYKKWFASLEGFHLGKPLGIDLPDEKGGSVPGVETFDQLYGKGRWKYSHIYSISIGQGELLMTPLQCANIAAMVANRGHFYSPHIVSSVFEANQQIIRRHESGIEKEHFKLVIDAMERVVTEGTGVRSYLPDVTICGKTSTVENPEGEDHAVFIAFAPKEKPRIAICVFLEQGGWGGNDAASIASLVIEKYLKGSVSRPNLQMRMIRKDPDEDQLAFISN